MSVRATSGRPKPEFLETVTDTFPALRSLTAEIQVSGDALAHFVSDSGKLAPHPPTVRDLGHSRDPNLVGWRHQ